MNGKFLLLIPMACLALAACKKDEQSKDDSATTCDDCKWKNFVNKAVPVHEVECNNNHGQHYHCHLNTHLKKPNREVWVMQDEATGGFSFKLETKEAGHEADRMECFNLVPDINDERVIQGTCAIQNAEHGPGVHHFKATLKPTMTPPHKAEIVFQFQHEPFGAEIEGEPVHNGEGHAHLD